WLLEIGADIFRTVWDREATLFILDFEYYNIAYPAEAYFKPYDVFYKLEEIYQRVKDLYKRYNLNFISIQTGQGYHFVFKVPFGTKQHNELVNLAYIEPTLQGKYNSISGRRKKKVSEETGKGFHMAGRLIEYICHKLLGNLKDYHGLPVVFGDVSVGKNREAIALDLSMYADPIYMRDIRIPFSIYQKHRIYDKFKLSTQNIPYFAVLVRENKNIIYFNNPTDIIDIRNDEKKILDVASMTTCEIPDNTEFLNTLIKRYQSSKLYKIHKQFDSCEHDPPEIWYKTYDKFNINILPPCVRHCLIEPNDHLLKPTNLQTLTRVLIKLGWHPKHIAGLIRSKYERNYGWGEIWYKYDAASRANFYVRIYSDLILTGIDKEEDLNCWSHFEKGYCWQPNCGFKLENYRLT
ncbi:MAG: hypothetical protein NZ928_04305, partial [Endomicrobia bacterium]|nr:hypothetical protein [Endomicrobiia bacterium]